MCKIFIQIANRRKAASTATPEIVQICSVLNSEPPGDFFFIIENERKNCVFSHNTQHQRQTELIIKMVCQNRKSSNGCIGWRTAIIDEQQKAHKRYDIDVVGGGGDRGTGTKRESNMICIFKKRSRVFMYEYHSHLAAVPTH